MQSRRDLVIAASALAATGSAGRAQAGDAKIVDYLLVQTARELTFDKASGTVSLIGVSPITLFFADRPERIAGNMRTAAFVPFRSEAPRTRTPPWKPTQSPFLSI